MRAYPTMKKNNPHTPIMLREAQGTEPRVFARYGMFCSIREEEEKLRAKWAFFFLFGWIGFGKEKQESLAGAYLFSVTRFFFGG